MNFLSNFGGKKVNNFYPQLHFKFNLRSLNPHGKSKMCMTIGKSEIVMSRTVY